VLGLAAVPAWRRRERLNREEEEETREWERERERERKREREEGWGDSLIDARSDSKINPNNDERFKNGSCFVQVGLWRSVPQDEGWRSVPQNVP